MQRRTWLALGAGSAVALALAGAPALLMAPALRDAKLAPPAREVFSSVARAVLDGTLPSGDAQPAALAALLDRVEGLIANLPPHAQDELAQLLSLLASAPGRRVFAGLAAPWPQASVADVQAALDAMRRSRVSLRQQAYQALHDIVGAAYFSEPATWNALGYPGPRSI